jgi:hypothetical protein
VPDLDDAPTPHALARWRTKRAVRALEVAVGEAGSTAQEAALLAALDSDDAACRAALLAALQELGVR